VKSAAKKKKKKKGLCHKCQAACCRYLALPIDKPKSRSDYDDIRWYLTHKDVSVFVEEGDWYINFNADCRHIDGKHRCAIYDHRPKICRGYSTHDCDHTSDEYDHELHFTNDRQMEEYMKVRFDNMKLSRKKSKAKKKRQQK
jgi:Fe-S-cluster containining protein